MRATSRPAAWNVTACVACEHSRVADTRVCGLFVLSRENTQLLESAPDAMFLTLAAYAGVEPTPLVTRALGAAPPTCVSTVSRPPDSRTKGNKYKDYQLILYGPVRPVLHAIANTVDVSNHDAGRNMLVSYMHPDTCSMRLLTRRLAFVCAICLALCRAAAAQPLTLDTPDERGAFSIGTLSFTPGTLALVGHDTNMMRAVGAPPSGEVFDVAQVEAWWKPGRYRVSGVAAFEYERELRDSRTGTYNNAQELNVFALTGRIRPSFTFSRHNHFAPPTDFSGFELGLKSRRIETQSEGNLSTLVGARTRLVGSARLAGISYDADARYQNVSLQDNLNRLGRYGALSLEHSLTAQTVVFELVEVGHDHYARTPLRDGRASFVGIGVRAQATAILSGSAFIGRRVYSSKTSALDNFQGLNWQANLAFSRPRYNVFLDARRDYYASYSAGLGRYVSTGGSLYASGHVSTRFDVYATTSRYGLDYAVRVPGAASRYQSNGAGIVYHFARALVGATSEFYAQRGGGALHGQRFTTYVQIGGGRIRRLDRPLPGER